LNSQACGPADYHLWSRETSEESSYLSFCIQQCLWSASAVSCGLLLQGKYFWAACQVLYALLVGRVGRMQQWLIDTWLSWAAQQPFLVSTCGGFWAGTEFAWKPAKGGGRIGHKEN